MANENPAGKKFFNYLVKFWLLYFLLLAAVVVFFYGITF